MSHAIESARVAPQRENIPLCSISWCENIANHVTLEGIPYCDEHYRERQKTVH